MSNDGGPAFPSQENVNDPRISGLLFTPGMTLRDYFAAKEDISDLDSLPTHMIEKIAGEKVPSIGIDPIGFITVEAKARAKIKYIRADAMLEARKS